MENNYKQIIDLINKLNNYTYLYDKGTPEITDKEWDNLYFELEKLEKETGIVYPNSPTQHIDYKVASALQKVKHNHSMLSLDKTKNVTEVEKFLNNKSMVIMAKMDGLTCSLKYINGELISAETRGNGEIGEDILHNAKVVRNIPITVPIKEEIVVDGEIICAYKDFKPFEEEYKNPRNFAAGSIRLLDSSECSRRNLSFVAWDLVKGCEEENSFSNRLGILGCLGFYVVPHVHLSIYDKDILEKNIKINQEYCRDTLPIDGIVFKFDDVAYGKSLGSTGHHARNAIAYKFYDEEYETYLKDIEFSMGRTGILTPVAIFNSVDIDGSNVERANLHNLAIMEEILGKYPYKGQQIWVAKMNMIIPQIIRSEKADNNSINEKLIITTLQICPICGEKLEINESNQLYCPNLECPGKLINHLDYFFGKKGLDVKGLSLATFDKLIDYGWINEIADVFNLKNHKQEWIMKPGFGEKSVEKILNSIELGKTTTLDRFICAIGIPLIGSNMAKQLAITFETWEEFRAAVNGKFDFTKLNDFGDITDQSIKKFDYTEADKLYTYLNVPPYKTQEQVSFKLDNKKIAITGSLKMFKNRDELKKLIEMAGGKVVSSVSKNTNILINNDNTSNSAKNITAQKLNIPILTEEEFIKEYID